MSAKVLHLSGKSPSAGPELASWGAALPKGPGVAAGEQGTLASGRASSLLGCGIRYTFRKLRKVTVSLCSTLVKVHVDTASSSGFKLEGAQERTTRLVKWEYLSEEARADLTGEKKMLFIYREMIQKTEVGTS